ncbi:hypothetical protein D1821_03650 [Phaeobacter inhibens]|uniref:hypothetical protein n=1 Tax=Phaeobacter inhibens TaxID=221822 RepID=UPI000160E945|nr:hypothetical protein [Phaeobacter inhibens]AFO86734.1 hypothetical protein PGA2_c07180 [Phaeobacter inhibens 2.10]AXT41546.1 hypothetical protein D1821_03650 [Phaeobacter inhibens]
MSDNNKDLHPEWLTQWRENTARWNKTVEGSAEEKQLTKDQDDIERRLMATPATTPAGMAAQIEFALENNLVGEDLKGGMFDGLDSNMFASITEGLKKMADASTAEVDICELYGTWQSITEKYETLDFSGDVSHGEFESLSAPILAERDKVESAIFATGCTTAKGQAIRVKIAAYFDWTVPDYNSAVLEHAEKVLG